MGYTPWDMEVGRKSASISRKARNLAVIISAILLARGCNRCESKNGERYNLNTNEIYNSYNQER